MVELVDTQDLKSCDLKSRAGSIPALSTKLSGNSELFRLHPFWEDSLLSFRHIFHLFRHIYKHQNS